MIPLRPYQQELVDNIRRAIGQGRHSVCAVLGCGAVWALQKLGGM